MDLQDLHQELQSIEKLKEQGKIHDAVAILQNVQKELKAHPVKNPRKYDPESNLPMDLCEKCGRKGNYIEQEDLCDFCYIAKHNLSQGDASISQKEMDEEKFDDFIKIYEEYGDR